MQVQSLKLWYEKLLASLWPESTLNLMKVTNLTRETTLASHVLVADSSKTRRKGLLGRSGLDAGEGIWIRPCESVHTFFMKFPIDVIYVDRQGRVKKAISSLPAWRISCCLTAHSVLEVAAGTIAETETKRGDVLQFLVISERNDQE